MAAFAETNRLPLICRKQKRSWLGAITEYAAHEIFFIFLGEYMAMITFAASLLSLYFGWLGCQDLDLLLFPREKVDCFMVC
ncbi:MAG: NADH-quinone oxidoreductase subunit H [Verrucomicrobiia bacterium]